MNELNFIKNTKELNLLAQRINELYGFEAITSNALSEIVKQGLATKVLNVVPCNVGIFYADYKTNKARDTIPDFIKKNFSIISVPSFSMSLAYAIPLCNYSFENATNTLPCPDLSKIDDYENKAIILTPMWSGYQVYEYKKTSDFNIPKLPGVLVEKICVDDDLHNKYNEYWFCYESINNGHNWRAHILKMPELSSSLTESHNNRRHFSNETELYYVDWTQSIRSLDETKKVANHWAKQDYQHNVAI